MLNPFKINRFIIFLFVYFVISAGSICFSQGKEIVIAVSKDEWQRIYDEYAERAILLLARLDSLNSRIDRLKTLDSIQTLSLQKCNEDLYSVLGTTGQGIVDYRKKFEETEQMISNKTGTPQDARRNYFDEISGLKMSCLPEFSNRYASMKKRLEEWEGSKQPEFVKSEVPEEKTYSIEGTYLVVKGDNLMKISELEYGTPDYWNIIWEANKNGVVNKDYFYREENRLIENPDFIYPGQILRIPALK